MINYEIRTVKESELEACLATLHAAFGDSAKRFGYTKQTYPSSGAYITLDDLKRAKADGVHMYAAFVGNVVAGYVQLQKKKDGVYMFRRFAVLPEYQKLGIGRALVSHCRERAALYGGRILRLIMIDKNTRLKDFYISNGFKTVGSQEAPSLPFDFFIMELELT